MIPQTLTTARVTEMLCINRATLMKMVSAGKFPQPVRLNSRTYRWNEDTVKAWLKDKEQEQCSTESPQA